MANILEKIVADKRIEIEARKKSQPLSEFIGTLQPTQKDMYKALSDKNAGFIFECKKASPSKGLIRPVFDVIEISNAYKPYASAISVLTDDKYFQGNHDYLKQVCENVDCPVLNKDFFIDPYQIHLGRFYGADAILLMLSVLSDNEYIELANVAQQYNMAILTEVSNEQETLRAIELGAKLIGINNRNLRDLSTDLSRTFELAPLIPDDRLIISESGIYTNAQVREIAPAVNGFLVGSSIMAQDDIDLACRKLTFGEHKVCGLTRKEDVDNVINSGAVYGGLIFAEKSPRCVSIEQAATLVNHVQEKAGLNFVGVFVDSPAEYVAKIAKTLSLSAIQLHGHEDVDYIKTLRKLINTDTLIESNATKVSEHKQSPLIIKALSVKGAVPEFNLDADLYLLDSKQGGSGEAFDWTLLTTGTHDFKDAMLAGGLTCANLPQALRLMDDSDLRSVDLNSGVESAPGIKDKHKLTQAFALIREY